MQYWETKADERDFSFPIFFSVKSRLLRLWIEKVKILGNYNTNANLPILIQYKLVSQYLIEKKIQRAVFQNSKKIRDLMVVFL